jgi:hypothetical protein
MNMVFWPCLINLYGNRKFGNHFVSMELRIWCEHCFVFIPSYHLHARLHSSTPIRIFARLTMPQVKILGMSWFVGIGWVFPTVTLGVLCALLLFCRHGESLLTDKRRIPLRSASVRTPHLFHYGIPKVLVNLRSKGITSVRSTTTH